MKQIRNNPVKYHAFNEKDFEEVTQMIVEREKEVAEWGKGDGNYSYADIRPAISACQTVVNKLLHLSCVYPETEICVAVREEILGSTPHI